MKSKEVMFLFGGWPLCRWQVWLFFSIIQPPLIFLYCVIDGFRYSPFLYFPLIPIVAVLGVFYIRLLDGLPYLSFKNGKLEILYRKKEILVDIDNQSNFYLDKGFWGKKIVFNQDCKNIEIYLFPNFRTFIKSHIDQLGDRERSTKIYDILTK